MSTIVVSESGEFRSIKNEPKPNLFCYRCVKYQGVEKDPEEITFHNDLDKAITEVLEFSDGYILNYAVRDDATVAIIVASRLLNPWEVRKIYKEGKL